MLESLDEEREEPTIVLEDNEECIILARSEGKFLTYEHIGLSCHYLREEVESGEKILKHISTD